MAELREVQSLVGKIRRERGFTMEPLRIFRRIYLTIYPILFSIPVLTSGVTYPSMRRCLRLGLRPQTMQNI